MAELLAGWDHVLSTYAHTMKVAVALTDAHGNQLGECHNPQPIWTAAYQGTKGSQILLLYLCRPSSAVHGSAGCLTDAEGSCGARFGRTDACGRSIGVGGHAIGAIIAGQVFDQFPDPLLLRRVASDGGISHQDLWRVAVQQIPKSRATLPDLW